MCRGRWSSSNQARTVYRGSQGGDGQAEVRRGRHGCDNPWYRSGQAEVKRGRHSHGVISPRLARPLRRLIADHGRVAPDLLRESFPVIDVGLLVASQRGAGYDRLSMISVGDGPADAERVFSATAGSRNDDDNEVMDEPLGRHSILLSAVSRADTWPNSNPLRVNTSRISDLRTNRDELQPKNAKYSKHCVPCSTKMQRPGRVTITRTGAVTLKCEQGCLDV